MSTNNTSGKSSSPFRTFASLDALGPSMVKFRAHGIPAVLEPSTATSATAESAGFLGDAALDTSVVGT